MADVEIKSVLSLRYRPKRVMWTEPHGSSQKEHTSEGSHIASIITEGSQEYADGDLAPLMLAIRQSRSPPPEEKFFRQMLKPETLQASQRRVVNTLHGSEALQ
jgi:hypothetical protein